MGAGDPTLLARDHTRASRPTCSATASRPSRAATTRSARTPAGLRDLLIALGHERATVVGHSLGGGIAMQFAYQFPERVERLVLVSSGGLGREVTLLLRAAALPGAELRCCRSSPRRGCSTPAPTVARGLGTIGLRAGSDLVGDGAGLRLARPTRGARARSSHTVRVGHRPGRPARQRRRPPLPRRRACPTLIVWGERDPIIPVAHARAAHAAMPGSRLEIFEQAGHFPLNDEPVRFAAVLADFIAGTAPAAIDDDRTRALMREHATTPAVTGATP